MDTPKINQSVYAELQNMLPDQYAALYCREAVEELAVFVAWFEKMITEIGQPGFAWQLGQQSDYAHRGVIGEVAMNSGTLGAGLHWLCKFYPLVQDATMLKLEVDDDIAVLSYRILDPTIWPRQHDALYSLGVLSSLIRAADPDIWPSVRISLEVSKRDAQCDVSRFVHTQVTYSAQTNSITFPASALKKPINKNGSVNSQQIKQLSASLAQKNRSMSIKERARYVILSDLLESRVSQEHVARELGLSSRTLRRKLSSEGLAYQELLDECRMELAAKEFATSTNVSLSQMALKLGYSEHSTFTRAFGRWSGMAPKKYRNTCSLAAGH